MFHDQIGMLRHRLLSIVQDDVCRPLMTVLGVGPVVALTFRATSTRPRIFGTSKRSSGVWTDVIPAPIRRERSSRRSRCGEETVRRMRYEALTGHASAFYEMDLLRARAMKIARHRVMKKAIVVALAVVSSLERKPHSETH